MTMSTAYTHVCALVDTVCAEAEAEDELSNGQTSTQSHHPSSLARSHTLSERQASFQKSQRRGSFFGTYKPDEVPEGPSALDTLKQDYREVVFGLMEDIRLNPIPNAHVDEDIAEDTVNWHTDVQNCNAVLTFLHSCLIWSDLELFSFRDLCKVLITLLQRDENGTPLEFVAWGYCAEKCHELKEGSEGGVDVLTSDIIAPLREYSPIHDRSKDDSDLLLAEGEGMDEKENTDHNNYMDATNNDVYGAMNSAMNREVDRDVNYDMQYNTSNEEPSDNMYSYGGGGSGGGSSRLPDHDVNTRMNNLRHRVLQRNQLAGSMIPNHYVIPEEDKVKETMDVAHLDDPFLMPVSEPVTVPQQQLQQQQQEDRPDDMLAEDVGMREDQEPFQSHQQPEEEVDPSLPQQQTVVEREDNKEEEEEEEEDSAEDQMLDNKEKLLPLLTMTRRTERRKRRRRRIKWHYCHPNSRVQVLYPPLNRLCAQHLKNPTVN